ncbi:P-loop containing nucleoside triphosphate hydrolase protein [Dactylonectria macrodidyma]|uniref:P-loop containing nucleoside triphosphate hydrolase protein n=1 Tax=Dactylonectria macrodidyma TaxID=307937 RepID=A0A9P9ENF1_9HYPO|nr:P-loop containing nucleoside triphosphate hydrolase protein [Dactylonectria macrodidyma]
MFCSRIVGALCGNYSGYYLRQISAQYKAALSAALHAKTLRLGDFKVSNQGADLATLGEVDTQILYRAVLQFSDVWALPLQTVLCLAGLAYLLPWQALVAVIAVTAIVVPLTATFVKSIAYWVACNMSAKDHRTKLIIEALGVMQSIKMHAWESTFVDLIAERRSSELKTVQSTAISTSGLVCCMQGLPSLLVLASFGVIVFLNKELTSELVFASLLLFTMLNNSLIQISGLASIMQAIRTSSKRIEMHLNLSEAKLSAFSVHQIELGLPMHLECKELGWPGCPPLVTSGSLQINPGALTVITGGMGCGKSTLLLAILRHLEQRFSSLNHFEIGHVPQKPLLFGGSIRDNILFGKPYDEQWYTQVIHACCLDADFERLQNGDKTIIIGSSTLSGGQSARVSLARAAYRRAAIYLLDDPIAAIDVKVSSEIMRRLLGSSGLLAQSTRVVCTADTAILQHADAIHDLTDGAVNFRLGQAQILNTIVAMESTVRPEDLLSMDPTTSKDSCLRTSASYAIEAESPGAPLSNALGHDRIAHAPPNSKSPILAYLLSAKRSSWLKATSLLLLARASSVMGTYVLKMMANDTSGSILTRHLAIFGLLSLSQITLFFCFVLALYKLCIVPAASKLHRDLTVAILSQSMSFFQTTQVGDILNLFTNDISRIDGSLNSSIASLMGQYTNLAFSCGVLVVSSPLSLGFTIPLLAATYQLQLVYLSKLRELRRLDASSRTPLLEYLQEAEKGRVAFATYKVADSRLAQFNHYLENNLRALFPLSCLDLWLGVRLEVASVILQIVALGFLLARGVDSGTLGFVMTYLFQVTTTLSYIAKISAQCEADAVSVARIDEYSRMSEKGEICLDNHNTVVPYSDAGPDAAWPQSGKVEFQSISARYRPGLPNSLDSVTLAIEPGEKVAVVGRTGAGKSSLALSMLRMMDRTGGQILIDNVDVASVSPVHLRRSLAVMPQAQVVLASSVRKNLDPLGRHSDEEIVQCLETCGLLNTISKLFGAEKTGFASRRSLFSKGENQIISLARAMLQKSKILVLDEATSGMDDSTEAFVHDLIFDKLRDTTVLAIMHRLNLTIHYDKVLIMDQGRVVSFGSPAALLADVEGPYFSMIQEDKELLSQARKYLGRA